MYVKLVVDVLADYQVIFYLYIPSFNEMMMTMTGLSKMVMVILVLRTCNTDIVPTCIGKQYIIYVYDWHLKKFCVVADVS